MEDIALQHMIIRRDGQLETSYLEALERAQRKKMYKDTAMGGLRLLKCLIIRLAVGISNGIEAWVEAGKDLK
jgi:hypothetical protein